MSKKLISVVVPVYNEQENLPDAYSRITNVMKGLTEYDYEIVFFDDGSTDSSRSLIEEYCSTDEHVKAVLYSRNFGYSKTIFYSAQQAKGDCAIMVHADLQNPPELIPEFVAEWEKGAQIVQGVKKKSKESPFLFFFRTIYYWMMIVVFGVKLTTHATEFQLFDASFIGVLRSIRDSHPFLRGIILEYGQKISYISFVQDRRNKGKSKFSIGKYYDFAINGIVSSSDRLPRRIIVVTIVLIAALIIEAILFFIFFARGMAADRIVLAIIIHFIAIAALVGQIFISFLLEYIIGVSKNVVDKPLVVEEGRINY